MPGPRKVAIAFFRDVEKSSTQRDYLLSRIVSRVGRPPLLLMVKILSYGMTLLLRESTVIINCPGGDSLDPREYKQIPFAKRVNQVPS